MKYDNCEFAKRKGNFINDYYQNKNDIEVASYIYEFHLLCGDWRFIISYNIIEDNIELMGFNIEEASNNNPLITHPENRLLKGK